MTVETMAILALAVLGLALMYPVHVALEYVCVLYARRYCRRQALDIQTFRCGPAFDSSGMKTEFTLVELECLDTSHQRVSLRLLIWLFGIREVLRREPSAARR